MLAWREHNIYYITSTKCIKRNNLNAVFFKFFITYNLACKSLHFRIFFYCFYLFYNLYVILYRSIFHYRHFLTQGQVNADSPSMARRDKNIFSETWKILMAISLLFIFCNSCIIIIHRTQRNLFRSDVARDDRIVVAACIIYNVQCK